MLYMKNSHLALRLSDELAAALEKRALLERVPKSQVAREAVARYLAPAGPIPGDGREVTAREVAARWNRLPRLSVDEATDLGAAIADAQEALPPVRSPWE